MQAGTRALDQELLFFRQHRPELLQKHSGQWVLIHDSKILGYYRSQLDAVNSGYEKLGNTPFLTRRVEQSEPQCEFASFTVDD